MAQVYVKKIGSDRNPIFAIQILNDDGTSSYKNISVSNVKYVSPDAQNEILSYLINNASKLNDVDLQSGAEYIASKNFQSEREALSGTYVQNGDLNTYGASEESNIWDSIKKASARFLGIDIGSSPSKSPDLLTSSKLGDTSVSKGTVNTLTKQLAAYKDINKTPLNPTSALRDVIGGADLSVFFMITYPAMEANNLSLPKDLQKKEIVILEMDNVLSISYSTMREIFPVRAIGHVNPKDHTRGPRTITGAIAFTIFSNDLLAYLRGMVIDRIRQIENNFTEFIKNNGKTDNTSDKYQEWLSFKQYYSKFINTTDKVQLLDSLPPFHILVMGTNERGTFSKLLLKDISVIDENQYQGTQQPHAINKLTFTCIDIVPMATFTNSASIISSIDSIDESFINGTYNSTFNISNEITGTKVLDDIQEQLSKNNNEISG